MLRCVVQAAIPAAMLVAAMVFTAGPATGGPGQFERQPDGQIRVNSEMPVMYQGEDEYLFANPGQGAAYGAFQRAFDSFPVGEMAAFDYRVQNDGTVPDRYRLSGAKSNADFKIKYFKAGGQDVTKDVKKGRFRTKSLDPQQKQYLQIEMTARGAEGEGDFFPLTATSVKDGGAIDVVVFAND